MLRCLFAADCFTKRLAPISAGDCVDAVTTLMPVAGTAGATAQRRNWGLFFFPAGIIAMQSAASASNGLEIEVVGKELCKDVA